MGGYLSAGKWFGGGAGKASPKKRKKKRGRDESDEDSVSEDEMMRTPQRLDLAKFHKFDHSPCPYPWNFRDHQGLKKTFKLNLALLPSLF